MHYRQTYTNAAIVEFQPFCSMLAELPLHFGSIPKRNCLEKSVSLSLLLYNTHISLATSDAEMEVFFAGMCRISSTHRSLENSSLIPLRFNKRYSPAELMQHILYTYTEYPQYQVILTTPPCHCLSPPSSSCLQVVLNVECPESGMVLAD